MPDDVTLPADRPCKYDGKPIVYDPREDVTTPKGRHRYGRHDGPCGRKLVLRRAFIHPLTDTRYPPRMGTRYPHQEGL